VRFPARFIAGNIVWARDSSVWALYRVAPTTYPYLSVREKLQLHSRTRAALLALPAQSMVLSLCRRIDPHAVVAAMVEGVNLARAPAWRDVAASTLDALEGTHASERLHFVAVELPAESRVRSLRGALGAGASSVAESFGLSPAPVRSRDVDARQRQTRQVSAQLSSVLDLRPASPGEIRWIYARAPRRGLDEPFLDESWEPRIRTHGEGPGATCSGPSLISLGDAIFKEGGTAEDPDRPRNHRRYLRVETEAGVAYQTFSCVAEMPHHFAFPDGGEWFFRADSTGIPVDWCARIKAVSNQEAQHKAKRQARQLAGQVGEYESETAGVPHTVSDAMEGVDDERSQLAANPGDPELQASIIFCTWADNLVDLETQAEQLRSSYEVNEYALPRPTGGQAGLFAAMLPGTATPSVARDYTQYLLPRDLAAGMPFAGCVVGDPRGMLLGASLDGGTFQPVLFDPAYGPSINRSGSLGGFGALGSGKSYAIKNIAWATLARGGQVVVMDRTASAEYVRFADVAPTRSQIVRLNAASPICLDPLQVFSGDERVQYTVGFLTLLTGSSPGEIEGVALDEAVREAAKRPGACLRDVVEVLEQMSGDDPHAMIGYRKLRSYAANALAQLVFGDGEALALDADYIVFHTAGLELPKKEVLDNPHLARMLLPEQIFSQALLYLLAAVARKVTFSNPRRFAAALFDEAWALTSSSQGRALVLDGIRDGRKHNAAVWLLSQHPDDLGDDALAHLLENRLVFRQSRGAAGAALRFLGMEVTEEAIQQLETLDAGRSLFRDVRNRIGFIQVLEAPSAELHDAFDTNPNRQPADDDEPGGATEAGTGRSVPLGAESAPEPEVATAPAPPAAPRLVVSRAADVDEDEEWAEADEAEAPLASSRYG
jgi:hypothetical protein